MADEIWVGEDLICCRIVVNDVFPRDDEDEDVG